MKKATDFHPQLLNLFDKYVHGMISRRQFFDGAARFAVGGVTVASLFESLEPNYGRVQVPQDAPELKTEYAEYPSPKGAGKMRGYLARQVDADGQLPGVIVIHENRGLNPHIEDVARRSAIAGLLAFAPDALTPLGGYPGTDDEGRTLQRQRDGDEMVEDFVAAAAYLKSHDECNGTIGAVGFCFGGGMANQLAVRIPDLAAAAPFYGGHPSAEDVAKIKAPLLVHLGSLDRRINAGWPAYEEALKANDVNYTMHMYEEANHGFHNDTTPRYDEEAAKLAWQRTVAFFNEHLRVVR